MALAQRDARITLTTLFVNSIYYHIFHKTDNILVLFHQ